MGVGPCKSNVSFACREQGLERWEKRGGLEGLNGGELTERRFRLSSR